MPCTSSHFSRDSERTKPSKLPRGWRPCPPQLADEKSGTVTLDQSGMRERQYSSLASGFLRQSWEKSLRLAPSSSSLGVGGPETQPPLIRERKPRAPRPCCTRMTCEGNQARPKLQRMPPWWLRSR